MKAILLVVLLDMVLLTVAWATGSFLGLILVISLCFILVSGFFLISSRLAPKQKQGSNLFNRFSHTSFN
jgi:Na+/H+-translocating membrane pyrophosphatase